LKPALKFFSRRLVYLALRAPRARRPRPARAPGPLRGAPRARAMSADRDAGKARAMARDLGGLDAHYGAGAEGHGATIDDVRGRGGAGARGAGRQRVPPRRATAAQLRARARGGPPRARRGPAPSTPPPPPRPAPPADDRRGGGRRR